MFWISCTHRNVFSFWIRNILWNKVDSFYSSLIISVLFLVLGIHFFSSFCMLLPAFALCNYIYIFYFISHSKTRRYTHIYISAWVTCVGCDPVWSNRMLYFFPVVVISCIFFFGNLLVFAPCVFTFINFLCLFSVVFFRCSLVAHYFLYTFFIHIYMYINILYTFFLLFHFTFVSLWSLCVYLKCVEDCFFAKVAMFQ